MPTAFNDEELPLPLLHRVARRAAPEAEDVDWVRQVAPRDRMRPGLAGALAGIVAGAAGLGVVHAMHPGSIGEGVTRVATTWGVPTDAALPLAYLAAASAGALVGAGFAALTQHLRRMVPLLVWAVIFFVSLTMLVLALSSAYGRGLGVALSPAILLASAVFAVLACLQLPLRGPRLGLPPR